MLVRLLNRSAVVVITTVVTLALNPWGLGSASGQNYDAPTDYYTTLNGLTTGTSIRNQLHLIISDNYWLDTNGGVNNFTPDGSGHNVRSYSDAAVAMWYVDADPNNESQVVINGNGTGSQFNNGKIILAYTGFSVNANWSNATVWNREHRWPASWGLGSSGADYSDIHMLIPANPGVNSQRSNYFYLGENQSGSHGIYSGFDGVGFFAGTQVASTGQGNDIGDSARALLYMDVRYDGADAATNNLQLIEGSGQQTSSGTGGDLSTVLAWHYRDVPDNHERRRNSRIFNDTYDQDTNFFNPGVGTSNVKFLNYQGNRNPFVDMPELVHAIFVDNANDTQLTLTGQGATTNGSGGSTADVQLGRVMQNQSVGALGTVSLTINKTGNDGTYYEVTTSGGATSDVEGKYNAFAIGSNGSRSINVGLGGAVDTSTPGLQGGTVTIDNLDVTTGGGTGKGANDSDDIINVGVAVLSKRQVTQSGGVIDLGTAIVGSTLQANFDLSTSGGDNERTRVETEGTAGNGVASVTTGIGDVLFDQASDTATYTLSLMQNSAGSTTSGLADTVNIGVSTAENGGGGLTGEGSYADVPVTYEATFLDASNASFESGSDDTDLVIDFGIVPFDTGLVDVDASLFNRESTLGLTADLDLDFVTVDSLSAGISTDLTEVLGVSAGSSIDFAVTLDTSVLGDLKAIWDLTVSDEDIIGETSQLLDDAITAMATVTFYGDLDLDFDVDVVDLGVLATNFGTSGSWVDGDFDGSGTVDVVDLGLFATNFGLTGTPVFEALLSAVESNDVELATAVFAAAVPEPGTAALLAASLGFFVMTTRRQVKA